jgi:hypothetical protein
MVIVPKGVAPVDKATVLAATKDHLMAAYNAKLISRHETTASYMFTTKLVVQYAKITT